MITLFVGTSLRDGEEVELAEAAVAHVRARRVSSGEPVRLLDGGGAIATGFIGALEKRRVTVQVETVKRVPAPVPLQVVVPVADRDRMLLAAEKCAELQVTAWRPAYFARSRSVNPRGEGPKFREMVEARMRSALEQSGGAWMPAVHEEAELEEVLAAVEAGKKLVLDSSGTSISPHISSDTIALLIGPEGGFETGELPKIIGRGWLPVALASTVLRFETAIISSVATVRALQLGH
jgi:16S rRNA (uracil1498-N3)-methyltransferase